MANPVFHVTIAGEEFLFSRQINYDQVRKITQVLLDHQPQEATQPKSSLGSLEAVSDQMQQPIHARQTRLSQYLVEVNASRTPDKIVALAEYYLEEYQQSTFTKDTLVEAFASALEPVPKNLNRDLRWAEKNGWIAEDPRQSGQFYLTKAGREAVHKRFPKEVIKKTRMRKSR